MRKLLIKLVAIETAMLGWLSYWLFLVYANNPSVAAELATSLQRFPQLSFSTVDIAVLVIVAALAVTLAFKFQRGLRPGIRLERALQMLENLMKRNLILESQVAELKIEKSHPGPMIAQTAPIIAPAPVEEPRSGSWERAFRTPLEAGPPSSRPAGSAGEDIPFGHQTGVPPPRIESRPPTPSTTKPAVIITEKGIDRTSHPATVFPNVAEKPPYAGSPSSSSNWEDSPQFVSESRGIMTPSAAPRKVPAVSESGGLKQPYIPAPAPKTTPPSIIAGPMVGPIPPKPPLTSAPPRVSRTSIRAIASPKTPATASPRPATAMNDVSRPDTAPPASSTAEIEHTPPANVSPPKPPSTEDASSKMEMSAKSLDETANPDEKTRTRESQPTKKKTSTEQE